MQSHFHRIWCTNFNGISHISNGSFRYAHTSYIPLQAHGTRIYEWLIFPLTPSNICMRYGPYVHLLAQTQFCANKNTRITCCNNRTYRPVRRCRRRRAHSKARRLCNACAFVFSQQDEIARQQRDVCKLVLCQRAHNITHNTT